jgi:hypothetical protein
MAHYAFLDESNIVTEVIVGIDETELIDGLTPENWYSLFRDQTCVRTSYNGKIRYNYAGVGYTYDPIDDAFIAPAPCKHETLVLNAEKRWECADCDAQALQSRTTA